jgi:hypothetical protein
VLVSPKTSQAICPTNQDAEAAAHSVQRCRLAGAAARRANSMPTRALKEEAVQATSQQARVESTPERLKSIAASARTIGIATREIAVFCGLIARPCLTRQVIGDLAGKCERGRRR